MRVEQRKLLMPMHDIDGVVDIQCDGAGWTRIAGAVDINHGVGQAHDLAQIGGILPARYGWLRTEVTPAVGQASTGELEAGIGAQMIEVVGILVAAGDGEHARAQDVGDAVRHECRVARVGDQRSQPGGDPEAGLDGGEQHDAAIGRHTSTIERGGDFLALHRWQRERQQGIFDHGGCGSVRFGKGWRRHPNLCFRSNVYATSANESLTCGE